MTIDVFNHFMPKAYLARLAELVPDHIAVTGFPRLKTLVDAGEIFHPLRWTPQEAIQLLKDVPQLEGAGVVVRMPAAWRYNRPPRPQVSAKIGGKAPAGFKLSSSLITSCCSGRCPPGIGSIFTPPNWLTMAVSFSFLPYTGSKPQAVRQITGNR